MDKPQLTKDCCYICGYQFSLEDWDKKEDEVCPRCRTTVTRLELITEDDDYAWVY